MTTASLYYLKSYAVLFLAAAVGATPWPARLARRLPPRWAWWLELLLLPGLLMLCTAYLVDGSFNPFLYFRF